MNDYKIAFFSFLLASTFSVIASAQSRYALLIGVSDYPSSSVPELSWSPIHGENDVVLLQPALAKMGFAVEARIGKDATAANIRKSLKGLQAKVKVGDVVYIHFSCHGQPVEDLSGDEQDGWDEAIVPYDAYKSYLKGVYEGENHILDDELAVSVDAVRRKVGPAGFVYVIVDACHAGGASRGEEVEDDLAEVFVRGTNSGFSASKKRFAPRIDARSHITLSSSRKLSGVCFVEACRSYQSNTEVRHEQTYYGPLSLYINMELGRMSSLTNSTHWLESVRSKMSNDSRLTRQNIVIESCR